MVYLQCGFCNHNNEVKSEYLTFCSECGKKLPDNYQDWKKENSGYNFEDYKSMVCQNNEPGREPEEIPKQKRRFTPLKIAVIISIALVVSFSFFWINNQGSSLAENIMDWGIRNMTFKSSNTAEWITYSNIENTFEIKIPAEPEKQVKTENTSNGQIEITIYMYETKLGKDDNLIYSVAHTKYPEHLINSERSSPEQMEQFFSRTIKGTVSSVRGKLKEEADLMYGLFPGKEFKVDFQNGMAEINYHFYLVQNTLYMLQVITATQNKGNQAIDYFFNSFHLLEPPAHY